MRHIDIRINKAKIISYTVELDDGEPHVTATIGLYANGKKISSFSLSTHSYHDMQFDLPAAMVPTLIGFAEQLEAELIQRCSQAVGYLPEKCGS